MCAPKHASQPPDGSALALLSMPSQSDKGIYYGCLLDLIMILQLGGGYTTAEGWTGLSG